MSFVSYAQNFEDVMLWRALKEINNGFYIDIGAWSPDIDSVTRAFYEKGWHGINIEPNRDFYLEYCSKRDRDINLNLAISDSEDEADFFIVSNPGLSSLSENVAKSHIKDGWDVKSEKVKVVTLNKIFEEYVRDRAVHFLKVDVEGLEEKVLIGNDWHKNRPWILLVEATRPMSQVEAYSHWEPLLLKSNYLFAYADGLNRFYIAKEHSALLDSFDYPPNVFDDFVLHHHAQAVYRAEQVEQKYALLEADHTKLKSETTRLNIELKSIYESKSWRITAPLRHFFNLARNVKKNIRNKLIYMTGGGMRYLSRIKHLKKLILLLVDRSPSLKRRLQRLMAQSTVASNLPIRGYARDEDFQDFLKPKAAEVKIKSLRLRDEHFSREEIASSLSLLSIDGHFSGSYSLASVNRNIVKRLKNNNSINIEISISPREGEKVNWIRDTPGGGEESNFLSKLIVNSGISSDGYSNKICLYHHYPIVEDVDPANGLPVALFFWEESRVPEDIIETLNSNYRGVIVTAWFVKKVLMDSGCILPVQVVSLPLIDNTLSSRSDRNFLERAQRKKELRLLHVSSCFPRKGVDVLLEAFNILASEISQVSLTIKTFPNPHNRINDWVDELVIEENRSRLKIIFEDYDTGMMTRLYKDSDIVVLPTRGEGLNMPAIEAAEFCRPVVVTGYGAHTDFAQDDNSWWIPYRFSQAQSHFSNSLSVWVDPSAHSLAARLKELCQKLLNDNDEVYEKTKRLKEKINGQFFSDTSNYSFLTALARLQRFNSVNHKNTDKLSIGIVTTWAEACGVAEYTRQLVENLSNSDCNIQVLAPKGRVDLENIQGSDDTPWHEAWDMGYSPDLSRIDLVDIVWLQHHFAFYGLDENLYRNLVALRSRDKLVYITLHTTRVMLGFTREAQEITSNCLSLFDRVFVHTVDDLNNLKRIGVVDNVTLMPQGVQESKFLLQEKKNERSNEEVFIVGCFGFLLEHKGVYQLITAFDDFLKNQKNAELYRLRLVTSVRGDNQSIKEFERCTRLVASLNREEHIEWHTDYLPIDEVEILLGGCDLLVLPYQFTQESSSAAVRTAIACCKNVATTPAPIFEEVRGITFSIDGFESKDIKKILEEAIDGFDVSTKSKVHENREKWILDRQWSKVAKTYSKIFRSAAMDAKFSEVTC
ncbi:FkbM family methyltransferase [Billgrantia kenyensis]|uniref:FkbM family methyltransferase n=1 Tax=Billgrantia kenyensis TaxID=321266 RepID=A0A7W0ADT9_9GAMM|nr:FkbM family methyltransferase [Halomonas kenyensis]MBA2778989.1 FkbM family methyltransferase [Halomonas kenyensis]MCG6662916.1 FkbM family methyltransferase [Halomonas kenyensis]